VPALHKAFATMGAITVVSSLAFWGLRKTDGANVSHHRATEVPNAESEAA
jgi:hypothetical protein